MFKPLVSPHCHSYSFSTTMGTPSSSLAARPEYSAANSGPLEPTRVSLDHRPSALSTSTEPIPIDAGSAAPPRFMPRFSPRYLTPSESAYFPGSSSNSIASHHRESVDSQRESFSSPPLPSSSRSSLTSTTPLLASSVNANAIAGSIDLNRDMVEVPTLSPGGTKMILYLNLAIMFISYLILSALAPFFPAVASECGLSPLEIGLVTAAYPTGMCCLSLLTGLFLPYVGTKVCLLVSLAISVTGSVVFGGIPHAACDSQNETVIFVLFFAVRFIQGGAAGVAETSVMFSISSFFADRIGQVLAYQELAIGVACMIGPLLGGAMYQVLHFFYTFVVFATIFSILAVMVIVIFPVTPSFANDENQNEKTEDSQSGVMSVSLAFSIFVLFVIALLNIMMVPILPLYLEESFGWGPLLCGSVFGASSLFYGITATSVGHVIDTMGIKQTGDYKLAYAIGFGIQAAGYWLLGPIPFEGIASIATVFVSFSVVAVGFAFCLIPTLPDLQLCALLQAGVDTNSNKSFISGLWQATYAIASAIGAPISGFLYAQIGFFHTADLCSGLALLLCILCVSFGAFQKTFRSEKGI